MAAGWAPGDGGSPISGQRNGPIAGPVDLIVEESAVGPVFDSLSVAYGAGQFGDAEMWVSHGVAAAA